MICAKGEFSSQQIDSEGIASFYDCQQFAFVGGIVSLGRIERLAIEKRRVFLFPFALK